MKFTTAISMLAAFPVIYAFNVYVRSSDDLIDVGDLDLFSHTWQAIYSAAGNKEAPCHFNGHIDHSVTLTIEGHWDDIGGSKHEYRDALVKASWESLRRLADQNSYNIWKDCCAETISTNCPAVGPNGCGATNSCHCPDGPNSRCRTLTKGHKVPSLMNISVSKNGAITANALRIAFRSDTKQQKGACGAVEIVAKAVSSFLFPLPLRPSLEPVSIFSVPRSTPQSHVSGHAIPPRANIPFYRTFLRY
ncbi:hypothetical protein MRS44_009782 [Fusarium solani]|uniref:uncharacterized protein n=1 Tax=Fusarium solani TaxID=169388 RepID=UPI0032C4810D|nr:hypothetical protein MRS44_009782 [Fusarium solani]